MARKSLPLRARAADSVALALLQGRWLHSNARPETGVNTAFIYFYWMFSEDQCLRGLGWSALPDISEKCPFIRGATGKRSAGDSDWISGGFLSFVCYAVTFNVIK